MGTTSSVRKTTHNVNRYKAFQRAKQRRRRRIIAVVLTVTALVVVALVFLYRADSSENVPAFELVHNPYSDIPASGRTLGNASAPVTVVEYGDYQCPGCGYFARELESRLVQDYVATGKVQFEFRDYAFIGDESTSAAEAAACADDQNAFWPFHETLFHSQLGENEGGFSAKRLEAMARGLGLDEDQFSSCLDDSVHADEVEDMRAEARALGIAGTPSFVVNGTLIEYSGYESLRTAIEAALTEK